MSSATSDTNTAKVREEIARAREILRARAAQAGSTAEGQEVFLRRYLRILSLQAVGQFSQAMAALSEGVTALTASHATHGDRLTALEQDLLSLVADLGRGGWPADRLDVLEARIAGLERTPAGRPAVVPAAPPYETIAQRLEGFVRQRDAAALGWEIGCDSADWRASADAIARVRLQQLGPEDLAARPDASVAVVSALYLFDAVGEREARRIATEARRVLDSGGIVFAVLDPLPATSGIDRPAGRRAVAAPGVLADVLRQAGFARVADTSLGDDDRGPRVVVAHRH